MNHFRLLAVAALFATFCCAPAQVQRGKATYYSKRATGSRTANGERLHHDSLTCAHRTHPFGTLLKVTNPANGKSVVVRVTDRGPYARNCVIDLSYSAAAKIGMLSKGIATVMIEKVEKGVPFRNDEEVQLPLFEFEVAGNDYVGHFKSKAVEKPHNSAKKLRCQLRQR